MSKELIVGITSSLNILVGLDETSVINNIPPPRRVFAVYFWIMGASKSVRCASNGWLPSWALDQLSVGFDPGAVAQAISDLEDAGIVLRSDDGLQFKRWDEYGTGEDETDLSVKL